jgi:hypothetical protein
MIKELSINVTYSDAFSERLVTLLIIVLTTLTADPIILSITSQSNLTKILKLQKKAIRIICNANYNAHTGPLFYQSGILPFDKIITYSKLMFMHAVAFNYNLDSFSNVWQTNTQRGLDMELRNANDFVLPQIQRLLNL